MNATYEKVEVILLHNGQIRTCYLHVVTPENGETIYFLQDYHGWSIDSLVTVKEAIQQYKDLQVAKAIIDAGK